MGAFGLVGLLFTTVGLYGILSFQAAQRTGEVGIRIALGGHPAAVLRALVVRGLRLAGAAVLVGLVASAFSTRLARGLMIGVSPLDPLTFSVVAIGLMFVAAAASWIPARRAARVPPMEALRAD